MTVLAYSLTRTIVIRAARATIFRYFTDSARWGDWWGAGSTIDARPGGQLRILYPDGTEALGEVLEVAAPERIVFSYGYASGQMIGAGGSRVTIRLESMSEGTRLTLTHDFADEVVRDHHVQGWRYQLSLFSNVVANEVNAGAAGTVDAWFSAWSVEDDALRAAALAQIAAAGVQFRDRFSTVDGLDDLVPHIGAALRFMPGIRLGRSGAVRHCQGVALADWKATGADGQTRGSGTNVFAFGADGKLISVVGFWN